jgi:hypothetical protein
VPVGWPKAGPAVVSASVALSLAPRLDFTASVVEVCIPGDGSVLGSASSGGSGRSPRAALAASTAACIRLMTASGSTGRADDPGPLLAAPGTRLASGGVGSSSAIRLTPSRFLSRAFL